MFTLRCTIRQEICIVKYTSRLYTTLPMPYKESQIKTISRLCCQNIPIGNKRIQPNSNLIGKQLDYFYVEIQALMPTAKTRNTVIPFYSRLQSSLKNSPHEIHQYSTHNGYSYKDTVKHLFHITFANNTCFHLNAQKFTSRFKFRIRDTPIKQKALH